MTAFSAWRLQKAIDSIISASSTIANAIGVSVANLPGRIFDNPAQAMQTLTFPYIVHGDSTSQSWDTKTENGANNTHTLHAWSRTGNKAEASLILESIQSILHEVSLTTLENNTQILCLWDGLAEVMLDDSEESVTHHGVIRFRIITQEA